MRTSVTRQTFRSTAHLSGDSYYQQSDEWACRKYWRHFIPHQNVLPQQAPACWHCRHSQLSRFFCQEYSSKFYGTTTFVSPSVYLDAGLKVIDPKAGRSESLWKGNIFVVYAT